MGELDDYNTHNMRRLKVDEMVELLLKLRTSSRSWTRHSASVQRPTLAGGKRVAAETADVGRCNDENRADTGAKGFIGRNLASHLRRARRGLWPYDLDYTEADLRRRRPRPTSSSIWRG